MAATHTTTGFNPSQSSLRLKPAHREALLGFAEISGAVTAQKLLDEAMEDFIQVCIVPRAEALLKTARKRQRSDARAAQKREVDACLARMEQDLRA